VARCSLIAIINYLFNNNTASIMNDHDTIGGNRFDPQNDEGPNDGSPRPPLISDLDVVVLLAYLKKRGSIMRVEAVLRKWRALGRNEDVLHILSRFGIDKVRVGRIGERVHVMIIDRPWADEWAMFHGKEQPHHAQVVRSERWTTEHKKYFK
jgi:hypothetical protein